MRVEKEGVLPFDKTPSCFMDWQDDGSYSTSAVALSSSRWIVSLLIFSRSRLLQTISWPSLSTTLRSQNSSSASGWNLMSTV